MLNMKVNPSAMGYSIKSGRLINNAPEPVMGLCKMVEMRKVMRQQQKIEKYAEAIRLGRMG